MNEAGHLQALARGEDSRQQFKLNASNGDGTDGLDAAVVRYLNQLISNAASQHFHPPRHPRIRKAETQIIDR